jgi:L-fuconolactonase
MHKIDAHQHFWHYNAVRDSWITDNMQVIKHDFLPADLLPQLSSNGIHGCIAVQADQSESENDFLLQLASENNFIRGVVGWVDLQAADVEDRLNYYSKFKKMKGFRHVLQGELQRDLMLTNAFKQGIGLLNKYGFTYDVLIFPDQLKFTEQLVALYPDQTFIIDHIAKPNIKGQKIDGWKENIQAIAKYPNVSCKVSGMVTEANWNTWQEADFKPYLDTIFEAFGFSRVLFGSDWPVCLVAATYSRMLDIVKHYTAKFSAQEQALFWGNNAIKIYRLDVNKT